MFFPMFAMVVLTFLIAIYLLVSRINAVRRREVSAGYFRLNQGKGEPSDRLIAAQNHFSNLFELPLLFYVTCLLAMVIGFQNSLLVICAWVFVVSRAVHAYIHLTYNNVIHRMLSFLLGALCILIMWLVIAANMIARQAIV